MGSRNKKSISWVNLGRTWYDNPSPPVSTPPLPELAQSRSAAINSGIIIDSIRVRVPSLIVCILVSLRSLKDASPGDTFALRMHDKRHCEGEKGYWNRFPPWIYSAA